MTEPSYYRRRIVLIQWQGWQCARETEAAGGVGNRAIEGFTAFIESRGPLWGESILR